MDNYGIYVGNKIDVQGLKEASATISFILESNNDQKTKRMALSVLQNAVSGSQSPSYNSFHNITVEMPTKGDSPAEVDSGERDYADNSYDLDEGDEEDGH